MTKSPDVDIIPLKDIKVIQTKFTEIPSFEQEEGIRGGYLAPNNSQNRAPSGFHEIEVGGPLTLSVLQNSIKRMKDMEFTQKKDKELADACIYRLEKSIASEKGKKEYLQEVIRHERMHKTQEIRFNAASLIDSAHDVLEELKPTKRLPDAKEPLTFLYGKFHGLVELQGAIAGIVNLSDPKDFYEISLYNEAFQALRQLKTLRDIPGSDGSFIAYIKARPQPVIYKLLSMFTLEPDIYEKVVRGEIKEKEIAEIMYENISLVVNKPQEFVAKITEKGFLEDLDRKIMDVATELGQSLDEVTKNYGISREQLLWYKNKPV